jgi:hypothetical protein
MTKSQLVCVLQVNDSETPPQCVCVALAPVNVSHIFYFQTFCTFYLKKVLTKVDGETAVVSRSEVSSLRVRI